MTTEPGANMDRKSIALHLVYIAGFLLLMVLNALVMPYIIDKPLGTEVLTPLAMIATGLIGVLAAAAAFEFGDSKGSQRKADTAAVASAVTADALATANKTIAAIATGTGSGTSTPESEPKPEDKKDA